MFLMIQFIGGVLGLGYALKNYRHQGLITILANELYKRGMARRDEIMAMSHHLEFQIVHKVLKPVTGRN